jgi:hypothetical protein
MDQMIFSEPSLMIWTYQDMMEWMSRILVGEKASAHVDFGSEDGQMWWVFLFKPTNPNPTQHDPHGPDDPFRTINCHHLDISGHDGMDEQDVDLRKGWC